MRAALLGTLVISACNRPAPDEVESEAIVTVKTVPATVGSIRGLVRATAVVTPAPGAELIVVAPETARVADLPRGEGDRVRRGDVLVRFEIPSTAADVERQAAEVLRAEAVLANVRANQARARDLFDRGIAARKEVEDADRAVADAQATLAQAEASRAAASAIAERSVVRATFDGVIAKRYHNPGDLVEASAADPVVRVLDSRRLELLASVPLSDVSRVAVGATAHLTAPPSGTPPVTLRVVSRPAVVDAGSATVPVRLAFGGAAPFPAGMPLQVDIEAEQRTGVVTVPMAAIVREGEETAVFVAMDGKAVRRSVKTGLSSGDQVEIVSGISQGDMVVIDGQAGLPDGATIALEATDSADVAAGTTTDSEGER